jgi:hypothetical protein
MSLLTNLISHWKLDEASGTRNDSHGTNHLTDVNTVGSAVGKIGNAAVYVSANNERLEVNSPSLQLDTPNDWSIAFWFNEPNVGTVDRLIRLGSTLTIRVNDFGGPSFIQVVYGGFFNSSSITIGDWHFLIAKYTASNTTVYIRVDNGTATTDNTSTGGTSSGDTFQIGGDLDPMTGMMDSVSFWNRAITSQEESDLWNSGNGLDYESFGGGAVLTPTRRRRVLISV